MASSKDYSDPRDALTSSPLELVPKAKRPMGRPTKYKEQFCEDLIEHARDGKSFETFAAKVGVDYETIMHWCDKYPDFLVAKKKARLLQLEWFENIGKMAMCGAVKDFNATVWIFSMKNRFRWKDRHEETVTVKAEDSKAEEKLKELQKKYQDLLNSISEVKEVETRSGTLRKDQNDT